ncbi:hypothetical protein GpartN1_g1951.t1 [Galdieria partita]|uniref:Glycosyl transferase family 25 domain-containing protein n=1 Tax=Galdieria partita TaxID=83374 RepID=A0A9C7PTH2_9RHOD|nr:hypothetical protein GpartN1_g1951.t1 [Galdieria partita]
MLHKKTPMFFPRIFIINLEQQHDRRRKIRKILEELGLEDQVHFLSAFTKNSELVEWYAYKCVPRETSGIGEKTGFLRGRPGKLEIAVFLSHLNAIKHIADLPEDEPYGIVCEDDVTFRTDFQEKVKEILPLGYDMVHLSYLFHDPPSAAIHSSKFLFETPLALSGAQCYLVRRSHAQYLVDKMDHPIRLIQPREGIEVTSELLLQRDSETTQVFIPDDSEPHCASIVYPPLAIERKQEGTRQVHPGHHWWFDKFRRAHSFVGENE